jgi:hypothetical protein
MDFAPYTVYPILMPWIDPINSIHLKTSYPSFPPSHSTVLIAEKSFYKGLLLIAVAQP